MLHFNFTPFPVLHTERLILRQMVPADAAALLNMRSNPALMQYIDRPIFTTIEEALGLIEKIQGHLDKKEGITWAIELQTKPGLIGTIGFWRTEPDNHRGEIGYMLHADYQRQGYTQEAMQAVLEYGFGTMQLHSVEANINPLNEASKKLLEKNGFVQEAYFKENFYSNGRFLDSIIYSLLTPHR